MNCCPLQAVLTWLNESLPITTEVSFVEAEHFYYLFRYLGSVYLYQVKSGREDSEALREFYSGILIRILHWYQEGKLTEEQYQETLIYGVQKGIID